MKKKNWIKCYNLLWEKAKSSEMLRLVVVLSCEFFSEQQFMTRNWWFMAIQIISHFIALFKFMNLSRSFSWTSLSLFMFSVPGRWYKWQSLHMLWFITEVGDVFSRNFFSCSARSNIRANETKVIWSLNYPLAKNCALFFLRRTVTSLLLQWRVFVC